MAKNRKVLWTPQDAKNCFPVPVVNRRPMAGFRPNLVHTAVGQTRPRWWFLGRFEGVTKPPCGRLGEPLKPAQHGWSPCLLELPSGPTRAHSSALGYLGAPANWGGSKLFSLLE